MTQKLSPEQKEANARVRKGARFMDKIKPEWAAEICPEYLDMSFPSQCILGQTFETYWDALNVLKLTEDEAAEMGFNVDLDARREGRTFDYDHLHVAWENEVFKRRMAVS